MTHQASSSESSPASAAAQPPFRPPSLRKRDPEGGVWCNLHPNHQDAFMLSISERWKLHHTPASYRYHAQGHTVCMDTALTSRLRSTRRARTTDVTRSCWSASGPRGVLGGSAFFYGRATARTSRLRSTLGVKRSCLQASPPPSDEGTKTLSPGRNEPPVPGA